MSLQLPISIYLMLMVLALIIASYWLLPSLWARVLIMLRRKWGRLTSARVQAGDINWHYLHGGQGEPLVLVHGFGADADHWVEVSRALGKHYRLYAPDTPGFGGTALPDDYDFCIQNQTDAFIGFLDALGIKKCHLAGNSMGGYLAADLATRYPQRVESLWLLAPFGMRTAEESETDRAIRTGKRSPFNVTSTAEFRRDVLGRMFARSFFLPYPLLHYYYKHARQRLEVSRNALQRIKQTSTALEEIAPAITQATLVQWGDADQVNHVSGAEPLTNAIPDAKMVIQIGTGHLPMLELPSDTADIFLSFQNAY